MSKSAEAWMPLYVGDYLGDTQRLTTEQHGAYILLILDYWRNGPAPDDDAVLQSITKLDRLAWKRNRPALERLFRVDDGYWTHKRIDAERAKASDRTSKAQAGADAKWGEAASGEKGKHLRSARLAEARRKGTHTPAQWEAMKAFCGHACVRCDSDGELVKDHITPIYQGGSDGIDNLQPLCRKCNASKGPEAIDHRPDGWQNACGAGVQRLRNASKSQSPSPSPDGDNSEADASGAEAPPAAIPDAKPIDLKAAVFAAGVPLLTASGSTDKAARSMLGKWRQAYGDGAVLDALAAAQAEAVSDAVPWITRTLEARNGNAPRSHFRDRPSGWAPRPGMAGREPAYLED